MAGSDPAGGAGLQLDLKVFAALGADGAAVPAMLTVQGPRGLERAEPLAAAHVTEAVRAVFESGTVAAVKLGALGSAANVEALAGLLAEHPQVPVVCDPVAGASRSARAGVHLLAPDALAPLRTLLLPRVTVLTPNLPEAELLTGLRVRSRADMEGAADALLELGAAAVLVKGGHLPPEEDAADLWRERGKEPFWITTPRLEGAGRVHGTGCALSSAIAAYLAGGLAAAAAVVRAREALLPWLRAAADGRLRPAPA